EFEGVEQYARLGHHDSGRRDLLGGERREVGLLLRVGTELRERGGHAGRREDRQRQPHVPVGECLGDQRVGDDATLGGDALERLGHVQHGRADLGRALQKRRGGLGGGVRVVGGGTDDLGGEVANRLDDHL